MYFHAHELAGSLVDLHMDMPLAPMNTKGADGILAKLPSNTLTIDIETGIIDLNQGVGAYDNNAYPMAVGIGVHRLGEAGNVYGFGAFTKANTTYCEFVIRHSATPLVIIGHNIKFDIQHLLVNKPYNMDVHTRYAWSMTGFRNAELLLDPDIQYWDTMLAHYLLSGQKDLMPSLATAYERYEHLLGAHLPTFKATKDWLKDQIAAGVPPQMCETGKLLDYLSNDVYATTLIAALQMDEAQKRGLMPLALQTMRALVACIEMEHNGLAIDRDRAMTAAGYGIKRINDLTERIDTSFRAIIPSWPKNAAIPAISNKTLDALFFGGTLVSERKEVVGTFKTGPRKGLDKYGYKYSDHTVTGIAPTSVFERTPSGERRWDEAALERVLNECRASVRTAHCSLIESHLKQKHVQKQLSTYITPALSAKYDPSRGGFILHHKLHQCTTATGRLSSSDPNLQNITAFQEENDPLNIKQLYVSRYEGGELVEADYKQIEVVALALVTEDPILINDILHGVDIHTATGVDVFGARPMTKEERRVVKVINFGLIYGGGAESLAAQAGVTKDLAVKIITAFFNRYPAVRRARNKWVGEVKEDTVAWLPCGKRSDRGVPLKGGITGTLSPTNRAFYFEEVGGNFGVGLPVTKIYNYPVQSLATADIVPTMLGILRTRLRKTPEMDGVLLVNTVHDSILLDCPPDKVERCKEFVKKTLEEAPRIISNIYDMKFELPLIAEVKSGKTWFYAA